ncbi:hypothetical protein ACFL20_06640 [Spirochaetota bacterium]
MPKLVAPEPPMPMEKIKDMLIFGLLAELRINLYHGLKQTLGDRKGREVYKQLYNDSSRRAVDNYLGPNPSVRKIVELELLNFQAMGFELEGTVEIEDGEEVFYEFFYKCPFWEYTKMKGIKEMPCDITCKYDSERGMDDGVGRWECLSRLADGADKCVFRIRDFKHFEKEDEIKKVLYDRTRLNSRYTERFNDDY